jgi:hypothetical protein
VTDREGVSTRRVPRWAVGATAWSAAVVLLGGTVTAATLEPPPVRAAAPAPAPRVAVDPVARPVSALPPAPAPVPELVEVPVEPVPVDIGSEALGPPPGPQVDVRPARVAAPEDRYAFLAGVTDYRSPTVDTIGSANDVRFLQQLLLDAGWLPQNIRVIIDGDVTGAALRDGMTWLAEKGRPGTFTHFHWSGHVKQLGGGTEALWPVDRDWVRDREVTALLSRVQGRMWVDIAGCEAGSFLPGLPNERVLVSASSRDVEKSYEFPDWGMSVWSGLLLDLGTRQRGADADLDGRVTIGESLRYATYYAQRITWNQEPYGRQIPQVAGDPELGWTLADPPA